MSSLSSLNTNPDAQSSLYNSNNGGSSYTREEGLLVMPVMGVPGTPPRIVRVHAPYGTREVRFAYSKRGTPPIFPSLGVNTPTDPITGNQDIFLSGSLTASTPTIGGNEDQLDYAVTGHYTYIQSNLRGPNDNYQTGQIPYQTNTFNANVIATIQGATLRNFANDYGQLNTPEGFILATSSDIPQPNNPYGWFDSDFLGQYGANASLINFADPNYRYFDTTISGLFACPDIIT